jgi:hypothetical protein
MDTAGRTTLSLRIRNDLRTFFADLAKSRGRSLSEETEALLERVKAESDAVVGALAITLGEGLDVVWVRATRAVQHVARIAEIFSGHPKKPGLGKSLEDPYARRHVALALREIASAIDVSDEEFAKASPNLIGEPAGTLARMMLDHLARDTVRGEMQGLLNDHKAPLDPKLRERITAYIGERQ